MSRRILLLLGFVLLSPGCVPVTEPVGDIDTAEPDAALVGTWTPARKSKEALEVDLKFEPAPEVKGNPKGLMRLTPIGYPFPADPKNGVELYCFTTRVGKEHFCNLLLDVTDPLGVAHLEKEGAYAKWSKGTGRRYVVFRYSTAKDSITTNFGDGAAFKALMNAEKFPQDDKSLIPQEKNSKIFSFQTPAGWLAKYLDKTGSDKIFPADKDAKMVRAK